MPLNISHSYARKIHSYTRIILIVLSHGFNRWVLPGAAGAVSFASGIVDDNALLPVDPRRVPPEDGLRTDCILGPLHGSYFSLHGGDLRSALRPKWLPPGCCI